VASVVATTAMLAVLTTAILLVLATPLAWWLARRPRWWKELIAAVTALPLVLPPTVIGFYLLLALGPESPLMAPFHLIGIRTLAFTFEGLVIGSLVYSLPFAVQPLRNAFEEVGAAPIEAALSLGATPLQSFLRVGLPLARGGYVAAAILVFAHTVGEFGVVLMIGGMIPGETEVLSTRLYTLVESMQWHQAHVIAGAMVAGAFIALAALMVTQRLTVFRDGRGE
jgi:molybdate transport system permease protein